MRETPSAHQWPSRLLGAALCLLFTAIALSAALQILHTMLRPLTIVGCVSAAVWVVFVVRRSSEDRW